MRHKVSSLSMILTIVASLLLLIDYEGSAFACSCAPQLTPMEELDRSAAVFSGKVANIKEDSSRSAYGVWFFVERSWKGDFADRELAPTVTVFTALDSAACGYAFEEDEKYLVYAYRSGESLDTNICSRTQPLGNAQEDLNSLGAEWKVYKANDDDRVFKIPYRITNGQLRGIDVDPDFTTIIATIESPSDGKIEIAIPRNLIDAKFDGGGGADDEFIVLVDGEEETYEEVNTSPCFRTLSIPIPRGTEEIEVIATSIMIWPPQKIEISPVYVNTWRDVRGLMISGCTNLALDDKEIILEVISPEGEMYQTMSVTPNRDGSFSTSLFVEDTHGSYTVKATYADYTYTYVPEFPVSLIILGVSFVGLLVAARLRWNRLNNPTSLNNLRTLPP